MIDEKNMPSAYAEVLAFIDALGAQYRNQIPTDILNIMEEKKDPNAVFTFHHAGEASTLSKEALSLVAWLDLEYWCQDEREKEHLWKALERNSQKEKMEQYRKLKENEAAPKQEEQIEVILKQNDEILKKQQYKKLMEKESE